MSCYVHSNESSLSSKYYEFGTGIKLYNFFCIVIKIELRYEMKFLLHLVRLKIALFGVSYEVSKN